MLGEFPLHEDLIYLNHAGVAPWPRRTCEAITRFAQENMSQGARDYPRWLEVERQLRELLAQLIGAPSPNDIALLKNTSEGLSMVAAGLEWRPGDNVLSFVGEFPSNRIVWESLAARGVELRLASLDGADDPEQNLFDLWDERTRLVAVSAVQYARGLRIDLERIGAFCRQRGVLLCVDAIQSLGALPFDAQGCQADFVVADGHKWLLAPEGLAVFYCRAALRDELRLQQFGWHMVEAAGDFNRTGWHPAPNATRFECGSPNMLGVHGLHASVSLLLGLGLRQISESILRNTAQMIDLTDSNGFELLSSRVPERRSGIVTFRVPGRDTASLQRWLMSRNVICAARGDGIRFSPHFYTSGEQLKRAFQLLRRRA
jgi:selenocysteine lyase/cysteine desulfurase